MHRFPQPERLIFNKSLSVQTNIAESHWGYFQPRELSSATCTDSSHISLGKPVYLPLHYVSLSLKTPDLARMLTGLLLILLGCVELYSQLQITFKKRLFMLLLSSELIYTHFYVCALGSLWLGSLSQSLSWVLHFLHKTLNL